MFTYTIYLRILVNVLCSLSSIEYIMRRQNKGDKQCWMVEVSSRLFSQYSRIQRWRIMIIPNPKPIDALRPQYPNLADFHIDTWDIETLDFWKMERSISVILPKIFGWNRWKLNVCNIICITSLYVVYAKFVYFYWEWGDVTAIDVIASVITAAAQVPHLYEKQCVIVAD